MIILVGVAGVGGAAFLGFRQASVVRGETEPVGPLSQTYTDPELGFSFQYPHGFRVHEIPQREGSEAVLVEDPARTHQGFQVVVIPYDDDGPLTEARIRQDVPDIAMEQAAPVQVAGEPGISFVQFQTPDVGKTYEVWFVHEHMLYETATYAERAALLQEVLNTWTFR
jgi:hypothetical protein